MRLERSYYERSVERRTLALGRWSVNLMQDRLMPLGHFEDNLKASIDIWFHGFYKLGTVYLVTFNKKILPTWGIYY